LDGDQNLYFQKAALWNAGGCRSLWIAVVCVSDTEATLHIEVGRGWDLPLQNNSRWTRLVLFAGSLLLVVN